MSSGTTIISHLCLLPFSNQRLTRTHVEGFPPGFPFFSYIAVDESVLPSPGVTSITRIIARTAIALPTRLLSGQITRSGCRHKPVLNGPGIYCSRPATATMGNELDLRMGASFRWTGSKQTIYGF